MCDLSDYSKCLQRTCSLVVPTGKSLTFGGREIEHRFIWVGIQEPHKRMFIALFVIVDILLLFKFSMGMVLHLRKYTHGPLY